MALTLKINVAKTAVENVFDMLNEANPAANVTAENLTLGTPEVMAADELGRNVSLVVTAKTAFTHNGSVAIKYRRLNIADETVETPSVAFNIGQNQDWTALATEIAAAWGMLDGEIEFTPPNIETADHGDTFTVEITAKADSLCYIGSKSVTLTYREPSLASLLTVTDLNGFATIDR